MSSCSPNLLRACHFRPPFLSPKRIIFNAFFTLACNSYALPLFPARKEDEARERNRERDREEGPRGRGGRHHGGGKGGTLLGRGGHHLPPAGGELGEREREREREKERRAEVHRKAAAATAAAARADREKQIALQVSLASAVPGQRW